MKFKIINIGKTKVVRIPAAMLKTCSNHYKVENGLKGSAILFKPDKTSRKGWSKAFKQMHHHEDDCMLIVASIDNQLLEAWD